MRLFLALAATGAVLAAPAAAVTRGAEDGTGHPYVGLVAFYDENDVFIQRCSGALLSPTVLLTAGHCTAGAALARAWFDPLVVPNRATAVTGAPHTYPGFDPAALPNASDVGIVVLDAPVAADRYASLAEEPSSVREYTVVGYGVQQVKPELVAVPVRLRAQTKLIRLFDLALRLSGSPGHGRGGACFGDSGGPVLDGDVIAAVVAAGSPNFICKGPFYASRVDVDEVRDWILAFLEQEAG
jgi:hypothetical protein